MAMGINKTRHNNTAGGIHDCGISHLKIATHRRNPIAFYQNVQVCLVADQGVLRCDMSIADNSLFHGTLLCRAKNHNSLCYSTQSVRHNNGALQ